MQFRILGPIEVVGDRGAVRLGGIKPRAVLAMLALHANEPVSAERLAIALWGEEAPATAIKTVHVHVSRLRRALGDVDRIATTPAGYCLRVHTGELDVTQFEALVEAGRRALADGEAERAALVLRDGLALWRGPPLADLAFEGFAAAEIARLEDQRLTALETRIEADLVAGGHFALVDELQQLVIEHPQRERLAGHLMLALYRGSRQVDALEVFREVRRVLVAELGVEPGPELRRLQEAILRHDGALAEVAPVELPPELDARAAPPLAGHRDELAWLRLRWERAREGVGAIIVLAGISGSGKSRLAAELAAAVHDDGGAVLYASADAADHAVLAQLRRSAQTMRPTLLVIDGADRGGAAVLAELGTMSQASRDLPLLVLACADATERLTDLRADGVLRLGSLDAAAVEVIARQYARGVADEDVPVDWMLEASGGIAQVVHEVASAWAQREASRRVDDVAGRAIAGQEELRSIHAELTGGVEALQELRERSAPRRLQAPLVCPFKGLASFETADAQYFFGREKLVAELVARFVGARLLGIVGPSGSGKSSVMRAGLLPALATGVLPGSESWLQVLIRPGEHPLRELADAMAAAGEHEQVVVAVDQFEETFTTCEDEEERAAFIAELGRRASDRGGRCVVVIALRADFYGRCAGYAELAGQLAANHVLVGPMRRDELRRAIELPALRVGLCVDPELADELVADVKDEPGGLPLLSTALLELWQRRDGRRLRHTVYQQTGGVRGAVARLAEDAFCRLDRDQQTLARGVLMRLSGESAAGGVERRRVALAELETESSADTATVVAMLTDRRLLTVSAGTIELAHEALLREWPRLRGWIEADREALRIHRTLNAAAREWENLDRDDGVLYRGARLSEAAEWSAAQQPSLNAPERAFLQASEALRELERRQRRRRVAVALGGLSVAVALISVVAVMAIVQGHEVGRQRDIAASRALAASATTMLNVDPGLSVTLAQRALERANTSEAENVLRQATYTARALDAWPTHRGVSRTLSVSRDGLTVATGGDDRTLAVRRMDSGRLLSRLRYRGAVIGVALSPDGRRVASATDDGRVVISTTDGRARHTVLALADETAAAYSAANYATAVSFSSDGRRLAVGTLDGTARVVRADGVGRVEILRGHEQQVFDIGFDRGGTRVISTSDDAVRVWNVRGDRDLRLAHPEARSASFSPDDRRIATVGHDGSLRLWRSDGGGPTLKIGVGQPLLYVRFSRDGRRVLTTAEDGVVRIFGVRGGPMLDALVRHRGWATCAAFVAGGKVVSQGEDGILRRWDPLDSANVRGSFLSATFSPIDNTRVLTGGSDGLVRLHDPASGAIIGTIGPDAGPTTARFSADGERVVTASLDGTVRISDMSTSRIIVKADPTAAKTAADLDRDARRVVSGGYNTDAVVQPVSGRGRHVVLRGHRAGLADVHFSPDSRYVVTASGDATARIWNAASGKLERTLAGHREGVNTAAYNIAGTRIVTASADGTIRIWPVQGSGGPVLHARTILRGHEGAVNAAAFSPDGTRIVSAGVDGTVRVWDAHKGGNTLVVLYTHRGGASSASFNRDASAVLSTGADGIARVSPCEVCGSQDAVRRLARTRPHRVLDAAERQRFLADDP